MKGDLENYKNKVKHDGFIIGHDYTNLDWAKAQDFGVVEAVNEFVVRNGWYFVALTMEEASTYVISRNMFLEKTKLLFHQLIYNIPNIIEIRNHPRDEFLYKNLYFNTEHGHQRRVLMSF